MTNVIIPIKEKTMGRDMDNLYDWRKKNIRIYNLTINKETEKDINDYFDKIPNKREYLLNLIRKDMKKNGR